MESINKSFVHHVQLLKSHVNKYALLGFIVSLILIAFAMTLVAYQQFGEITWTTFLSSQKNNPVLWVLDFTPFLFVIWGQTISASMSNEINAIMKKSLSYKNQAINKLLYDNNTGLPNRILLIDLLSEAINLAYNKNKKFSLIIIDIVNFKKINDAVGVQDGMRILEEIGTRLKNNIPSSDILAHFGDNEFCIISFNANKKNKAITFARQLEKVFEKPFSIGGVNLRAKNIIGIALFPQHGSDPETLIRHANVAIYTAKQMQTRFNIYHPTENQTPNYKKILMKELRHAIKNDELILHFQPKVSLKNQKMAGAEALVFWHHPSHGLLSANDFLSLAKQTGLAEPLTQWMLKKSIDQYFQWQADHIPMKLSINLSWLDTLTENFLHTINELLKDKNLMPQTLTFEIPENALMINKYRCTKILTFLNEHGIRLSIKDFGLGYSSLSYFCKLPIQEIKINPSLIMTLSEASQNQKIVQALILLGHYLNLDVVAEGISSKEIYDKLVAWNCDQGQGAYISRPINASKIIRFSDTASI